MQQAPLLDGLSFDAIALEQDRLSAAEVDVGRGEIAEALVVAAMVVVLDEGRNPAFEIARQVVVFQQDAVLQRLMPVDLPPESGGVRSERHAAAGMATTSMPALASAGVR